MTAKFASCCRTQFLPATRLRLQKERVTELGAIVSRQQTRIATWRRWITQDELQRAHGRLQWRSERLERLLDEIARRDPDLLLSDEDLPL